MYNDNGNWLGTFTHAGTQVMTVFQCQYSVWLSLWPKAIVVY